MKRWSGRIIQVILAAAGITFFFLLVGDVDIDSLPEASLDRLPLLIGGILLLLLINYTFDTAGWWLVCGEKRPSLFRLMLIRLRAEAITNVVPGGAVIGEPMKVGFLMQESGMDRTEATTSFLLSKFVLVVGQSIYILVGLALAFSVIDRASQQYFGVENFGLLVLGGALLILGLLVGTAGAMVFAQPMNRKLRLSKGEGRIARLWNRLLTELRSIETLVAAEFRRRPGRFPVAILFSFISWSLNGVELWLISQWLGLEVALITMIAIDAVSVIVRMIVFVVPIGMGGQDWTIAGLVGAYGIAEPTQTAARLVLLKRGREFTVIGLGLLLLLVMPNRLQSPKEESGEASASITDTGRE